MKRVFLLAFVPVCLLLLGASNGEWLHRVSSKDHARTNPLLENSESADHAARAGAQLFQNECAKCHASDGGGLHGRPPVISDRVNNASDGDLFWMMTNGNPWHGMPPWNMLPAAQRWQLVAFLREINRDDNAPPVRTAHGIDPSHATSNGATR